MLELEFTDEQLDTFDAALDLLFSRGYEIEVKHQSPKMIGDKLIQYSIMRINPEIPNVTYGDILVRLTLQGNKSNISFWVTVDGQLEEIEYQFIRNLKVYNSF